MNRRHVARDAKGKGRVSDEPKREIHPAGCAVWVRLYEWSDRYSADFFDLEDQFMFTVDVPNDLLKREDISNHFEVLARFYDDNVWRR